MLIHLLSSCGERQKEKIIEVLSKPREKKAKNDVTFIFDTMRENGSIEYAKSVARQLSERALDEFEKIVAYQRLDRGDDYRLTRTLIEYLSSREY